MPEGFPPRRFGKIYGFVRIACGGGMREIGNCPIQTIFLSQMSQLFFLLLFLGDIMLNNGFADDRH